MIKKKIEYDETENPKTTYSGEFEIIEKIENGCFLIDVEDNSWVKDKSVFQLKGFGEKDNDDMPIAKRGQRVKIQIQIF